MKRFLTLFTVILVLTVFVSTGFAQKPAEQKAVEAPKEAQSAETVTVSVDKTNLSGGGKLTITGKAPAGKDVYIEVWAEKTVRAARLDADPDPKTGKSHTYFI